MDCALCGGELRHGTAPFHVDRKGVHLTIDHIPAWVCSQCGEPSFEESAVASIQTILRTVDEQTEQLLHAV